VEPKRFRGWVKEVIPKEWKQTLVSVIQFAIAIGILYAFGQNGQMVEELFWVIAFLVAVLATLMFRLFHVILSSAPVTLSAKYITLILIAALYLAVFLFGYHGAVKRMDSAEIEEYRDREYFRDESVFIKNVVGSDGVLKNKTFEGCALYGPAYLYISSNVEIITSRVRLNAEFITAEDGQELKIGAVVVDSCKFVDSWFFSVSIIGTESQIEDLKDRMTANTNAAPW
jgi:hypothetical protein